MRNGSPQLHDVVFAGKQFSQFRRIIVFSFKYSKINVDIFRIVGDCLSVDV
jgi:hypothetical protein